MLMKRLSVLLLMLSLTGTGLALPPVPVRTPAPPAPAPIIVPEIVIPPPPVPPPPASTKLGANVWWVAQSTAPFSVLPSTTGLVKVEKVKGPVTMRGWFVEAPDTVQTRSFAGPFVITVEAVSTGKCELLVGTDIENLKRICLDVVVGPPVPPVPPKPPDPPAPPVPPTPPTPIPGAGLHALIIWDASKALTPDLDSILHTTGAGSVRDYLTAKCAQVGEKGKEKADWAMWQDGYKPDDIKDYPSPPIRAMYSRPRASLPWLVISNGTKGTFYEGPLPATKAEVLALLQKYEG